MTSRGQRYNPYISESLLRHRCVGPDTLSSSGIEGGLALIPRASENPVGPPRSWHDVWQFKDMPEHFEIWSAVSRDGGKSFTASFKLSTAPSPGVSRRRGMHNLGRDYISIALDETFVHMTWFDDRSGFRATWYGRVPLTDYK